MTTIEIINNRIAVLQSSLAEQKEKTRIFISDLAECTRVYRLIDDLELQIHTLEDLAAIFILKISHVMTEWTKEWPIERGRYWFYGQTSKIAWDLEPEYISVRVRKDGTGKQIYVGGGRFLYKGEGARGLWTPMVMPTPPTDFQIEEVLK